jgi:hypothetical protein
VSVGVVVRLKVPAGVVRRLVAHRGDGR